MSIKDRPVSRRLSRAYNAPPMSGRTLPGAIYGEYPGLANYVAGKIQHRSAGDILKRTLFRACRSSSRSAKRISRGGKLWTTRLSSRRYVLPSHAMEVV